MRKWVIALALVFLTGFLLNSSPASVPLDDPDRWAAFDAGNTGGLNTKGYSGVVFDGRYLYFAPLSDGGINHGRVLRYDTQGAFTAATSWAAFDAGNTDGLNTNGYSGVVFDGRYLYFAPLSDGGINHGRVLRYDTQGAFTAATSWAAFDAGNTDGLNTNGYSGVVFDGRYLYFAPLSDGGINHGRVLRYDTQGAFTAATSWAAFDADNTGGLNTNGYSGVVFDGRYLYFAPLSDGGINHGRVLRYDTQGAFTAATSWAAFDAGNTDGLNTKGYSGVVFDGRYLYFAPLSDGGSNHGRVLRYDTQGAFTAATSWAAFDAGNTDGLNTNGYSGVVFDGRYLYFAPLSDGGINHGRVLRYDTQGAFTAATSWAAFDAGNTDGLNTKGYSGVVFDGRYLYFAPLSDSFINHGRVLRYDTAEDQQSVLLALHGTGPNNNPPTLTLDENVPTAGAAKYRDSSPVNFARGNPWKEIGISSTAPALTEGTLVALSDLAVWVGLKNSDDQGTRFDLRAEVYRNDALVAEGETLCIEGVTRNPDLAKAVSVPLALVVGPPAIFNGTSDELRLRILTRIGTDGASGFCGGHSTASGLRLYFDGAARPSSFGATMQP